MKTTKTNQTRKYFMAITSFSAISGVGYSSSISAVFYKEIRRINRNMNANMGKKKRNMI